MTRAPPSVDRVRCERRACRSRHGARSTCVRTAAGGWARARDLGFAVAVVTAATTKLFWRAVRLARRGRQGRAGCLTPAPRAPLARKHAVERGPDAHAPFNPHRIHFHPAHNPSDGDFRRDREKNIAPRPARRHPDTGPLDGSEQKIGEIGSFRATPGPEQIPSSFDSRLQYHDPSRVPKD